jgi:hypothetical protein
MKMKTSMKKAFVTITAVSCLACGASLASAQPMQIMPISAPIQGEVVPISAPIGGEVVPISAPAYEIAQQHKLSSIRVYGQAAQIEENRITLENGGENAEFPSIVINISEDTRILNAVDGMPVKLADIRENESVYAYVGPAMTKSLPPITNAELILVGIPADFAVPSYVEVESVETGESGQVVVNTNRDESFVVGKDTSIFPFLTKNIVTVDDIRPGTKLLAWPQATLDGSKPAEDGKLATKVMLFAYDYKGFAGVGLDKLTINGESIELGASEQPYVQNGQLMLPFRKFVEAIGLEINWDGESRSITVLNGDTSVYSFKAGGSEVENGGEEPQELREASFVKDGVTFVAADDLFELNGVKYVK